MPSKDPGSTALRLSHDLMERPAGFGEPVLVPAGVGVAIAIPIKEISPSTHLYNYGLKRLKIFIIVLVNKKS